MKADKSPVKVAWHLLGLPGVSAIGLFAVAAWEIGFDFPTIANETAALTAELHQILGKSSAGDGRAIAAAMASIYARLPRSDATNFELAPLLVSAGRENLSTESAQYRTSPSRLPGVWRHEVTLPIKGHYEGLRNWLDQAQRNYPSLSVDSLDIGRSDVHTDDLEAHVTISLWIQQRSSEFPVRANPTSAVGDRSISLLTQQAGARP